MLFLVTGASGVGKSTVREHLAPRLGASFEAVELRDLDPDGEAGVAWRQRTAEIAARRAAAAHPDGHVLLSGDPVAAGEALAAPSAVAAGGVAVCLLDADEASQRRRLAGRGDDEATLAAHVGFARWMRDHAADPTSRLDVLTRHGAAGMRWDRLQVAARHPSRWRVHTLDTSRRAPEETAAEVEAWIRRALLDGSGVMCPETWE